MNPIDQLIDAEVRALRQRDHALPPTSLNLAVRQTTVRPVTNRTLKLALGAIPALGVILLATLASQRILMAPAGADQLHKLEYSPGPNGEMRISGELWVSGNRFCHKLYEYRPGRTLVSWKAHDGKDHFWYERGGPIHINQHVDEGEAIDTLATYVRIFANFPAPRVRRNVVKGREVVDEYIFQTNTPVIYTRPNSNTILELAQFDSKGHPTGRWIYQYPSELAEGLFAQPDIKGVSTVRHSVPQRGEQGPSERILPTGG